MECCVGAHSGTGARSPPNHSRPPANHEGLQRRQDRHFAFCMTTPSPALSYVAESPPVHKPATFADHSEQSLEQHDVSTRYTCCHISARVSPVVILLPALQVAAAFQFTAVVGPAGRRQGCPFPGSNYANHHAVERGETEPGTIPPIRGDVRNRAQQEYRSYSGAGQRRAQQTPSSDGPRRLVRSYEIFSSGPPT